MVRGAHRDRLRLPAWDTLWLGGWATDSKEKDWRPGRFRSLDPVYHDLFHLGQESILLKSVGKF